MKDIIEIKYIFEKNKGRLRIFGDKFVENNKRHCKMIIKEEELELSPFYRDDNKNSEEDISDINEYFYEELFNEK